MAKKRRTSGVEELPVAEHRTIDLTAEEARNAEDYAVDRTVDPVTNEPVYVESETAIPPPEAIDYPPPETVIVTEPVPQPVTTGARFSPMAILTGTLVAFGLVVLGSLATGLTWTNTDAELRSLTSPTLGVPAGIVLVGSLLIAFVWGGYAAGRMARANGIVHGLIVPALALGIGALVVLIVDAAGETPRFALPYTGGRFAIDRASVEGFGLAIAVESLAAMFVGGMIGGWAGVRWHRRIETRALSEQHYRRAMARTS